MEYYVRTKVIKEFHAGNKAREDCEEIFETLNFKVLDVKSTNFSKNKFYEKLQKYYYLLRNIPIYIKGYKSLKKKDTIFYQFPFTSVSERILLGIVKLKKVKVVLIIHDLDGIREKNLKKLEKEMKILKSADQLISHNNKMTKLLKEKYNIWLPIKELLIFDYLVKEENKQLEVKIEKKINEQKIICYAGNLDSKKSSFIYKLYQINNIKFNIYGINYNKSLNKNSFCYCGAYPPNVIHTKLLGDYGLIWDGNSLKMCEGLYGEYLKYNNPHKLSLYIVSGLPIIVWNKAAIADYIIENNLGITISSLEEIEEKISNITEKEYKIMKENVLKLQEKIKKGEVLKQILNKILEEGEKKN